MNDSRILKRDRCKESSKASFDHRTVRGDGPRGRVLVCARGRRRLLQLFFEHL